MAVFLRLDCIGLVEKHTADYVVGSSSLLSVSAVFVPFENIDGALYIGLNWGCDGFLSRWRQGLNEVTDPALALVSIGLGCNTCTLTLPHLCVLMFLLLSPARAHDRRS